MTIPNGTIGNNQTQDKTSTRGLSIALSVGAEQRTSCVSTESLNSSKIMQSRRNGQANSASKPRALPMRKCDSLAAEFGLPWQERRVVKVGRPTRQLVVEVSSAPCHPCEDKWRLKTPRDVPLVSCGLVTPADEALQVVVNETSAFLETLSHSTGRGNGATRWCASASCSIAT